MVPLSERTQKLVEHFHRGECLAEAVALLQNDCADNLPFCENHQPHDLERLRFAALKISGGDWKKLRDAVRLAQIDWRDLLMAADFGYRLNAHERWAEDVLKDKR